MSAHSCRLPQATSDLCAQWDAAWVIPGEVLLMADPVSWSMLAWLRMCRPGTITTMSQTRYLQSIQGRAGVEKQLAPEECCTIL
eukprot:Skav221976  [mRNA]  locus=scaffold195:995573:1003897:- [translate_table: standard]